ncbi:hypothetical protein Leryth_001976 [Lithospermum erythrorhizon]|nr:hypothetical protein Leryth_001976 [Lithospermum erythrorhizon]
MKTVQDKKHTTETQSSSHESQHEHPNNATDNPVADAGSVSVASNENRKVSREDIELVQNLIERCLQLYMNKEEVVKTLLNRARIDPGFTTLVWQKLEEENADFFRAYFIRLKLKKQIILFNHLLEHQYNLMKYPAPPKVPLAPMQNGIHPMPVNNMPMGYPVLPQPPMPHTGQPHFDPMACGMPGYHGVNGVPAQGNLHAMRMNSGNDMLIDSGAAGAPPIMPQSGTMPPVSEMPLSPTSVSSSGRFPFSASEISGMGADASALDAAFTSDMVLPPENGTATTRSFDQISWNFSLSDLTADLSNLGGTLHLVLSIIKFLPCMVFLTLPV